MILRHRRAVAIAGATIAATWLLTGCSTSAPTTSSTADPTTPSPEVTETDTAADPTDPSGWIIDFGRVGPLAVGGSLAEVGASMTAFTDSTQDACPWVTAYEASEQPSIWLPHPNDTGAIEQIVIQDWADPASIGAETPHTTAGIGIGSTVDELLAAYPGIAETTSKNFRTFSLGGDSSFINFSIAVDSDLISSIVLRDSASIDSEYCS